MRSETGARKATKHGVSPGGVNSLRKFRKLVESWLQSYPTQRAKERDVYILTLAQYHTVGSFTSCCMWGKRRVSAEKDLRQLESGQEHWGSQGDGKMGRAWMGSMVCLLLQPICKGQMFDRQNGGWESETSTHHTCKLSAERQHMVSLQTMLTVIISFSTNTGSVSEKPKTYILPKSGESEAPKHAMTPLEKWDSLAVECVWLSQEWNSSTDVLRSTYPPPCKATT